MQKKTGQQKQNCEGMGMLKRGDKVVQCKRCAGTGIKQSSRDQHQRATCATPFLTSRNRINEGGWGHSTSSCLLPEDLSRDVPLDPVLAASWSAKGGSWDPLTSFTHPPRKSCP